MTGICADRRPDANAAELPAAVGDTGSCGGNGETVCGSYPMVAGLASGLT